MNKALALVFLASFAIIAMSSTADAASKDNKFFFRPRPWIPLNIPIPPPPAAGPPAAGGPAAGGPAAGGPAAGGPAAGGPAAGGPAAGTP